MYKIRNCIYINDLLTHFVTSCNVRMLCKFGTFIPGMLGEFDKPICSLIFETNINTKIAN